MTSLEPPGAGGGVAVAEATLVGKVRVGTGSADDVLVRLIGPDGSTDVMSVTTGALTGSSDVGDGRYRLVGLRVGRHVVEFSRGDVGTERRTIVLTEGLNTLDVDLAGVLAPRLPMNLVDDSFVRRFLKIFENVHQTVASHVDSLEMYADPAVAPSRMITGWLRCFGLDHESIGHREFTLPEQRRLVGALGSLIGERGTSIGLLRLLALLLFDDAELRALEDARVAPSDDDPDRFAGLQDLAVLDGGARQGDALRDAVSFDGPGRCTLDIGGAQIAVSDNGGVFGPGGSTRAEGDVPLVIVDVPRLGSFARDELVDLIRGEVPPHVFVAVRLIRTDRSDAEPEELFVGPAVGTTDREKW